MFEYFLILVLGLVLFIGSVFLIIFTVKDSWATWFTYVKAGIPLVLSLPCLYLTIPEVKGIVTEFPNKKAHVL